MSTSLLYHAFGIRGYQYTRTDYQGGQTIFTIHQEPETCRCSACGSPEVRLSMDPNPYAVTEPELLRSLSLS